MPEERIEVDCSLPYLSILDAEGNFDEELGSELDDSTTVQLFEQMLLARKFDEKRLELQRQGSIGTFAPVKGQEAANLGPVAALREQDWFIPSFREPAAAVYRGASLESILLYDAGFAEGGQIPEGSHNLPNCVPVGTQLPHAVGIAHASRLQEKDEVSMVFFGDGATSEGDFHEAMNFAATWKAPVVFLCQNNQWAISVPREKQTASKTLAQKALAYGMPGVVVDGNDIHATYLAAKRACDRARAGEGPTMIECVTYRLAMHTTADDPSRYREEAEVEEWEKRDPLRRLRQFVLQRELITEDDVEKLAKQADDRIDQAWTAAKRSMKELEKHPERMFEHQYASLPEHLQRQRKAFLDDRHRDSSNPENRDGSSQREEQGAS